MGHGLLRAPLAPPRTERPHRPRILFAVWRQSAIQQRVPGGCDRSRCYPAARSAVSGTAAAKGCIGAKVSRLRNFFNQVAMPVLQWPSSQTTERSEHRCARRKRMALAADSVGGATT